MVESWEQNWAFYMDRTKEALPERWRVNLLLRMLPEENKQDISLKYVQNIKTVTYAQLCEQVFAYCTSNSKGLGGMHLDALQPNADDDEDLDALRKGTRKGGQASTASKIQGRCNYCNKVGHKEKDFGK